MIRQKSLWLAVLIGLLALMACTPAATPTEEATDAPTEEATEEPTEVMTEEPTEVMTEEPTETAEATEAAMMFGDEVCNEDLTGESITFWQQAGTTGPLAQILGPGFINGTQDGIDALNNSGGICGATVELEFRDTAYEAEQEVAAYMEAVEAGVPFVLTYGTPASVALKEFVNENKIANIAAGLDAQSFYVPRNGYTVGVAPIYPDQFAGFLQWVSDNWADIKPEAAGDDIIVGVIGWDNPFGAGATTPEALAFAEELGITVLELETATPSAEADLTGPVTNLLSQGANVIYNQSLSITPAQVVLTLRGAGQYENVVVGGVNWSMNTDVQGIIGTVTGDPTGAAYADYYGVFPYLWWNDVEEPAVEEITAAFEAGGYPPQDKAVGYLLSYAAIDALAQITFRAIQDNGFENLNGETWFAAFQELGTVSASGMFDLNVEGENRAPNMAQIRQVQVVDGVPQFVVVEDWFELPDMRPPAEEE